MTTRLVPPRARAHPARRLYRCSAARAGRLAGGRA